MTVNYSRVFLLRELSGFRRSEEGGRVGGQNRKRRRGRWKGERKVGIGIKAG